MARNFLELILISWHRGRNGKPRKRLKGLSPAQAYAAKPTPEDIQRAREWLLELQRRQERARRTREARRDPVRLQLLKQGLTELGIADPNGSLVVALAGYAREAIARGLATFRTKKELGTLPPLEEPGRYLAGIIRNLDMRLEQQLLSIHLLQQRIRLRDLSLEPLHREARRLRADLPMHTLLGAFVERALGATFTVDFLFWAQAAADALAALPPTARSTQYQVLCRQVAATFKADRDRRADLIERLAESVAMAA